MSWRLSSECMSIRLSRGLACVGTLVGRLREKVGEHVVGLDEHGLGGVQQHGALVEHGRALAATIYARATGQRLHVALQILRTFFLPHLPLRSFLAHFFLVALSAQPLAACGTPGTMLAHDV